MGWLAGWSNRKTVTITGQAGAGTNYQVNLSIGDASGGDFHLESHCTSFPNDIQVTDNDQTTPLDYWVEDLTIDPISMWVEVADSLDSNADVCVYYHKSGESSASNGANTFPDFYNDFEGETVGNLPSGWSSPSFGTFEIASDQTKHGTRSAKYVGSASGNLIVNKACSLDNNKALIFWWRSDFASDFNGCRIINNAGTTGIYLQMRENNNFEWFDGSWHVVGTWSPDIWYKHEINEIDTTNYQYDWYIDDVLEATNATFENNIALEKLEFRDWSGAYATGWIDTIIARKYLSPTEPAYLSASAEESAPAGAIMNQFQKANLGADLFDGGLIT